MNPQPQTHGFQEDLEWAEQQDSIWQRFWRDYYGDDFIGCQTLTDQRIQIISAIDRLIVLRSGNRTIQEKHRRKDYADQNMLFEDHHKWRNGRTKPGWARQRGNYDLLAYAPINGYVLIIPYQQLCKVLDNHYSDWRQPYEEGVLEWKQARNQGYVTNNILVPVPTLQRLIPEMVQAPFYNYLARKQPQPQKPCNWPGCESMDTRPYMPGPRCDRHSPAAVRAGVTA